MKSGVALDGRYGKQDFVYLVNEDAYRCPAGEKLTHRWTTHDQGHVLRKYAALACRDCALKAQCTTGKERVISRWEHEAVMEKVQSRLDHNPDAMRVRRRSIRLAR